MSKAYTIGRRLGIDAENVQLFIENHPDPTVDAVCNITDAPVDEETRELIAEYIKEVESRIPNFNRAQP